MIDGTIQIIVPELPDASVWFQNAAAWSNYWRNISATLSFPGADTTLYIPVPYDITLQPCVQIIDGIQYVLITQEMFDSLHNRLDALEASYEDLRTELKDASIITNAQ